MSYIYFQVRPSIYKQVSRLSLLSELINLRKGSFGNFINTTISYTLWRHPSITFEIRSINPNKKFIRSLGYTEFSAHVRFVRMCLDPLNFPCLIDADGVPLINLHPPLSFFSFSSSVFSLFRFTPAQLWILNSQIWLLHGNIISIRLQIETQVLNPVIFFFHCLVLYFNHFCSLHCSSIC